MYDPIHEISLHSDPTIVDSFGESVEYLDGIENNLTKFLDVEDIPLYLNSVESSTFTKLESNDSDNILVDITNQGFATFDRYVPELIESGVLEYIDNHPDIDFSEYIRTQAVDHLEEHDYLGFVQTIANSFEIKIELSDDKGLFHVTMDCDEQSTPTAEVLKTPEPEIIEIEDKLPEGKCTIVDSSSLLNEIGINTEPTNQSIDIELNLKDWVFTSENPTTDQLKNFQSYINNLRDYYQNNCSLEHSPLSVDNHNIYVYEDIPGYKLNPNFVWNLYSAFDHLNDNYSTRTVDQEIYIQNGDNYKIISKGDIYSIGTSMYEANTDMYINPIQPLFPSLLPITARIPEVGSISYVPYSSDPQKNNLIYNFATEFAQGSLDGYLTLEESLQQEQIANSFGEIINSVVNGEPYETYSNKFINPEFLFRDYGDDQFEIIQYKFDQYQFIQSLFSDSKLLTPEE